MTNQRREEKRAEMKHLKVDCINQKTESGAGPHVATPKEIGTGPVAVKGLAR